MRWKSSNYLEINTVFVLSECLCAMAFVLLKHFEASKQVNLYLCWTKLICCWSCRLVNCQSRLDAQSKNYMFGKPKLFCTILLNAVPIGSIGNNNKTLVLCSQCNTKDAELFGKLRHAELRSLASPINTAPRNEHWQHYIGWFISCYTAHARTGSSLFTGFPVSCVAGLVFQSCSRMCSILELSIRQKTRKDGEHTDIHNRWKTLKGTSTMASAPNFPENKAPSMEAKYFCFVKSPTK